MTKNRENHKRTTHPQAETESRPPPYYILMTKAGNLKIYYVILHKITMLEHSTSPLT